MNASRELKKHYFSIVVVTYNAENSVIPTLESLDRQSCQDFETIVVDGCSEDGTIETIRKSGFRVDQLLVEPDKGIYDAMNKGMELASGKFIAFLNAGDKYVEGGLELVKKHTKNTAVRLFSMDYVVVSSGDRKRTISCRALELRFLKKDFKACHQSIFVDRRICVKYDLNFDILADYQWAIDLSRNCKSPKEIGHLPVPVTLYEAGGYSSRNLIRNLRERVHIHYSNFGVLQVIVNSPNYLRRILRGINENTVRWRL